MPERSRSPLAGLAFLAALGILATAAATMIPSASNRTERTNLQPHSERVAAPANRSTRVCDDHWAPYPLSEPTEPKFEFLESTVESGKTMKFPVVQGPPGAQVEEFIVLRRATNSVVGWARPEGSGLRFGSCESFRLGGQENLAPAWGATLTNVDLAAGHYDLVPIFSAAGFAHSSGLRRYSVDVVERPSSPNPASLPSCGERAAVVPSTRWRATKDAPMTVDLSVAHLGRRPCQADMAVEVFIFDGQTQVWDRLFPVSVRLPEQHLDAIARWTWAKPCSRTYGTRIVVRSGRWVADSGRLRLPRCSRSPTLTEQKVDRS